MNADRRPLRPIPWWWAPVGAAVVGLAVWLSTWWLLSQTGGLHGVDEATARMDAIKSGLSVGAGTGGAVALLLALRRQWLGERDQAHREAVDQRTGIHSERVAAAAEHDAAERRVTDLYGKAADQLGSEKAPVRMAGLYALERLAQDNVGHRTTIVKLLCAYLRMPYMAPEDVPIAASDDPNDIARTEREHRVSREELQVRQAAQRILATHLRDEAYVDQRQTGSIPETFWEDISIDLSGAHLIDFFLGDSRAVTVNFNRTKFTGETIFRGLHCDLGFFQNATFAGHTDFRGANFANSAWFNYATFAIEVWFHADEFYPGARFGRHVSFGKTIFTGGARFTQAVFDGSADFEGAKYSPGAEAIRLDGAHVRDVGATSPEVSQEPSSWPQGWVVKPGPDNTGTLAWAGASPSLARTKKTQ